MKRTTRWIVMVLGVSVAAFGMGLLNLAGLGNVCTAVLWDGMSNVIPVSIGVSSYIASVAMVLFLLVYDKKQIRLGTIIVFILYGFVLDLTVMYVPAPENTLLQWVVMFVGIIVFGIGIGVYAYTDLGRGPYDGICFAFVEKKNWQMKYVRAVADGSCLVAGFLMGGEIGVATVTSMILSGYFIQITTEVMDKIVRNRCAA